MINDFFFPKSKSSPCESHNNKKAPTEINWWSRRQKNQQLDHVKPHNDTHREEVEDFYF